MTIRNLDDDVRDKLRVRAAQHGRSTEAEVRAILAESVESPVERIMIECLVQLRDAGTDSDFGIPSWVRDEEPRNPFARSSTPTFSPNSCVGIPRMSSPRGLKPTLTQRSPSPP